MTHQTTADALRADAAARGFAIIDTPAGPEWRGQVAAGAPLGG